MGQVLTKNSPTILTGLSVTGLLTTVGMAVQATPKAMAIIDDEFWERYEVEGCDYDYATRLKSLSFKEKISLTWKCYVPTAIMGVLTIGCIIGANSINLRRNAALASVYSITETALKEYQAKVVETLGEAKAKKIKDDIAKDRVQNNPVNNKEVIITGKGEMLCYDPISGRYFKNDIEKIRKAQNDLNRDLLADMCISLNDIYYGIGLPETKIGDDLGWYINDGLIEFDFSSQLTENGEPCLVLGYKVDPRYNYRDF